ncbi:hypothetical protein C8034_v001550 [Colletotrichum sidae]|uniref:Uncharacterized protein n=1 Tax=Colletotrichum sidae TaxID=1347389 RepID=A0A4R8TDI4_9PEZI|nr:hypothetical protein C8034_v001550 [Colletotrichum sidae]
MGRARGSKHKPRLQLDGERPGGMPDATILDCPVELSSLLFASSEQSSGGGVASGENYFLGTLTPSQSSSHASDLRYDNSRKHALDCQEQEYGLAEANSLERLQPNHYPSPRSCPCDEVLGEILAARPLASTHNPKATPASFEQIMDWNKSALGGVRRIVACNETHGSQLASRFLLLAQVILSMCDEAWWSWCEPTYHTRVDNTSGDFRQGWETGIESHAIDQEDVPFLRTQLVSLLVQKLLKVLNQTELIGDEGDLDRLNIEVLQESAWRLIGKLERRGT